MIRLLFLTGFLAVSALTFTAAAEDGTPLWLRHPAVSPDGSTICFAHAGQIWRVASSGGEATPLTSGDGYSTRPVWSPDGKNIAFASKQHGNFDVFLIPAAGGTIKRLTTHSANDLPSAFAPDGQSVYFSSSRLGAPESVLVGTYAESDQLYTVPVTGGNSRLVLPTPALDVAVSPDGRQLLYDNRPVYENEFRKGAVSAGTRDIWLYDLTRKTHRRMTGNRGEDRDAFWAANGKSFFFLSERDGGSFNVWQQPLNEGGQAKQITHHKGQPVRFVSLAADGSLVYGFEGSIWRQAAGSAEAERVPVHISQTSLISGTFSANANPYASEIAVSPSGEEVAVVARGEVFVVATASGRTRRVTSTPEFEHDVSFSPDGRTLLYCSEREGDSDIYEASVAAGHPASFTTAGAVTEKKVIDTDGDAFFPTYSPDGKRIAFLDNRRAIKVVDRENGKSVTVLPEGSIYSYQDGDLSLRWSPDGRFLVATTGSIIGDMDVSLLDASGKAAPIDLSTSGYSDSNPQFTANGKAVVWLSDRSGLRKSDATASQMDVYIAHLTQEAFDAYAQAQNGVNPEAAAQPDSAWQPQAQGIRHRTTRLTPYSLSNMLFQAVLPDKANLILVVAEEPGSLVGYRLNLNSRAFAKIFTRPLTTGIINIDAKGENLYTVGPAGIERIRLADGSAAPIAFDAKIDYDPRGELSYLFQYFWRMTKLKFYQPDMHGRDWEAIRASYAAYLPHMHQWEDFVDLLSEMAGELNASHMGSYFLHQQPLADDTASLGIYEYTGHTGKGVRVATALTGGPCDGAKSQIGPGTVLLAVDGQGVDFNEQLYALLNRKAGIPVELTLLPAVGGRPITQIVTPVTRAQERELAYDHWVEGRKKLTDELSKNRIGYVHINEMDEANYQRTVDQVFGESRDKDALIVDVRFNRGGLLHDQLAALFTGDVKGAFITRDGLNMGNIPTRRWGRPTALLVNAGSYSDGSIFPHLYQRYGIGQVVGDPVPGTGTAVWWINVLGKIKYGIPQLGAKDIKTGWFENNETVPDIQVSNDPGAIAGGHDPQLEAAVQELLKAKSK